MNRHLNDTVVFFNQTNFNLQFCNTDNGFMCLNVFFSAHNLNSLREEVLDKTTEIAKITPREILNLFYLNASLFKKS